MTMILFLRLINNRLWRTYEYTFSELIDPTIVGKYTVVACTHLEMMIILLTTANKIIYALPNESIPQYGF